MSNWSNAGRVRPVSKGTWSSAVSYTVLDLVTSSDKLRSYIATQNVPAGTPLTNTAYWQVLVDATAINDTANSLMDRLASPFDKSGSVVTCHPVEGYSLKTKTLVKPAQSGSGDPSPSNIRPISGHTGAKLTKCGKNLAEQIVYGYVTLDGNNAYVRIDNNSTSVIAGVVEGNEYTISCSATLDRFGVGKLEAANPTNGALLTGYRFYGNQSSVHELHFTAEFTGTAFIYLKSTKDETAKDSLQVEIGSVATEYTPYQGETFTANFGQNVYGGTLDWGKGVLKVDMASESLTSAKINSVTDAGTSTQMFVIGINNASFDGYAISDAPASSHYKGVKWYSNPWNVDMSVSHYSQYNLRIRDSRFGSIADYGTYLNAQNAAGTPVQIVYKLATPITIQLTPTQILALKGTNTLYSDCGDTAVFGRIDPEWMNEQLKNAIIALGGNV